MLVGKERPEMEASDRAFLSEIYHYHNQRLEQLMGRELSAWIYSDLQLPTILARSLLPRLWAYAIPLLATPPDHLHADESSPS